MSNPDLRAALEAVRDTLRRENDKPGGPIRDTIWHTPHETLFDFIDGALSTEAAAMAATVPAEPIALDHIACIEDGELRFMSGRKAPAYDCELYAMPDGKNAPPLFAQAPVAGQPAEPSPADLWYLQDTRSHVGNDVLWWAKDGKGYTTDVSKAHVFTHDEAWRQAAMRSCDRAWPKAYIDGKTRPAVDMQYINHDEALDFAPKGDSNG